MVARRGGAADTGGGRSLAVVTVAAMLLLIGGAGGALPAERLGKMTNLIVCYADWGQCDGKVLTGAQQGCNVLVWFAINTGLLFRSRKSSPACRASRRQVACGWARTPSCNLPAKDLLHGQ